ncbi:uncharacterized protein LTR77_008474 [Saxophila tyrrhenica]|uniref:Rhodopsin domain-containing protein n=1 Tax=Saxophila tyrrhenica TaxID=1690608 RepID=A0AAV9P551_9PEZI|nr:hypothetical protein LTR77_008474 [Saxophila tyrrhenica]
MARRLEPGQSPPLAVITPDDQRGVIFVTGGLALAATMVCLVVRAYVRMGSGQAFGSDDYAIALSFLFMIAQTIALFISAGDGLGVTSSLIGHAEGVSMQKAILAADIFYLFALWSTRCASALFFQRMSRVTRHEMFWKVMLGAIPVLGLASVLTVALRCELSHAWLFIDQHCTGLFDRWVAATVIDVVFEVALFTQPLFMVAKLQMATKLKIKVISSFGGRLVVIIPLILHLLALRPFYEWTDGQKVSSYTMMRPYIYTQICLALAIITPTVPLLQPFMQATTTSFGMVSGQATNSYSDPMSRQSRSNWRSNQDKESSFAQHVTSSSSRRSQHKGLENPNQYSVSAVHNRRVSHSGSDVSQQPMIRRDVQYEVSYSEGPAS